MIMRLLNIGHLVLFIDKLEIIRLIKEFVRRTIVISLG